ncbi:hypothetical protein SALBM311S_08847 [Streptomyces alboniger]
MGPFQLQPFWRDLMTQIDIAPGLGEVIGEMVEEVLDVFLVLRMRAALGGS